MVRRIAGVDRGTEVRISVDGRALSAYAGESLAAALAAEGVLVLRHSPSAGAPRGMFCLMGVCQECVVACDGRIVVACMEPVQDGMVVTLDPLRSANPDGAGGDTAA